MASGERGGSLRNESPKGVVASPFASRFGSGHEGRKRGRGELPVGKSI